MPHPACRAAAGNRRVAAFPAAQSIAVNRPL
jgi:hypothetical protein